MATTKEGELRWYFSITEIAKALRVHNDTILRRIHRSEITAVRWGGQLRVPEDELERIMQRQREGRDFKPETVNQFIPHEEHNQSNDQTLVQQPAKVRKRRNAATRPLASSGKEEYKNAGISLRPDMINAAKKYAEREGFGTVSSLMRYLLVKEFKRHARHPRKDEE